MDGREPSSALPTLTELRSLMVPGGGTLRPGSALYDVMMHPLAFVAGEAQAVVTGRHDGIMRVLTAYTGLGNQPVQRVQRTRDLMTRIEFGSPMESELAARRLWDIHDALRSFDADGNPLRATDPELLAVLMIMGQMCSATWNVLMTSMVSKRDLPHRADELFAAMWMDKEPSRASIGIPAGYLQDDPADATAWLMDTLDRRWNNGPEARLIADIVLGLPRGYVEQRFPGRWAKVLRLPAAAVTYAAVATATLSLRGRVVLKAGDLSSPRVISLGLASARSIRLALAALPESTVRAIVDSPSIGEAPVAGERSGC